MKSAFFAILIGISTLALCLVTPVPARSGARPPERRTSFRIEGAVEKSDDWTVERLSKEFAGEVKTVSYMRKETKEEARCVPLLSLVQAAKPRLNPKVKNHALAFVVLVRADDGYTMAFSMGELTPAVGKRDVWLALDLNGKPLSEEDGPVQLLVPQDEKPARWVHGVATITVVDGFELANPKRK